MEWMEIAAGIAVAMAFFMLGMEYEKRRRRAKILKYITRRLENLGKEKNENFKGSD
jgi:hypothetical protein